MSGTIKFFAEYQGRLYTERKLTYEIFSEESSLIKSLVIEIENNATWKNSIFKKTSELVNSAKKGSDIEAQLHVRTHLFHKLFFGVASPGVFRATHFLMVKVIHNDRVPRLCSSVGQLVVHEGTAVFFRQPFRLILQTTEVASVSLVVDSVVQRNQVRIFFTYIVKDVFFEDASQV